MNVWTNDNQKSSRSEDNRRNHALFGTWDTGLSPSGNLYLKSVMKEMVCEQWEDHLNCKFLLVALHFTCLIFTLENTDKKQRYWCQTLQQFFVPDLKCINVISESALLSLPQWVRHLGNEVWNNSAYSSPS